MRILVGLAGCVLATTLALARAEALPPPVQDRAGELAPLGRGEMRWLGIKLYDAALWVPAGRGWAPSGPHVLEIRYARNFSRERLVETSLEEMARLGFADPAQQARWGAALARAFPDVAAGEVLIGLHRPGEGAWFWHGARPTAVIDDPELARAFFAIWLDPRTREPGLRARLLGDG